MHITSYNNGFTTYVQVSSLPTLTIHMSHIVLRDNPRSPAADGSKLGDCTPWISWMKKVPIDITFPVSVDTLW